MAGNCLSGVVVGSLEGKVDVSVYLKEEATDNDVTRLRADLEQLSTVARVEYVSRERALADFRERHAQDALIQESLAELETNPLQASLNIKANDPGDYASIVSYLETPTLRSVLDKINFYENEAVIGRVQRTSSTVQEGGMLATLALAVIAVLVAFNTVRLTIYNQQQEIEIQRLVGASNWYIPAPYLIEGGMYGIVAAVLALAVWYVGAAAMSPKVALVMSGVSLIGYFGGNLPQVGGVPLG